VLNNIGWLIFDKVFVLLINLLVIVKIANYYGPEQYGSFQYAVSIITLFGILVQFIDDRVVKKQYGELDHSYIIGNVTVAKTVISLVAGLSGLLLLVCIPSDRDFQIMYSVLLCNMIVQSAGMGLQNYFEYNLNSKRIVIAAQVATVVSSLLQLAAIVLHYRITVIAGIILFSSIIKLAMLIVQFFHCYRLRLSLRIDFSFVKKLLIESIPLAIAAVAATVYTRIDQVMIGSMLGVSEVGIYAISNKLIGVVAIAIAPVQASVFPKMLEWHALDKKVYYSRYQMITSLMTWIYITGTIASLLILPFIFDRFFTQEYQRSLDVFRIHVIGTFFMYNAVLRSSHFTINGKTKIMLVTQLIAVGANIILNFLLIPISGIYGAASATAITQFLSLFLLNSFFQAGKEVFWIELKGFNPYYIFKR
jgi:O-antigen/teichoic acid export membrane protein